MIAELERIGHSPSTQLSIYENGDRHPDYGLPLRLSWDEFMAWADEHTHAEWVDGTVQWRSPVSIDDSDLNVFLTALLGFWTEHHQAGDIHVEPFMMRLASRPSGREPVLIFVASENRHRFRQNYLDGPADLVIEIISPESRERDAVAKRREYERGSVREYWLLDPVTGRARFYGLNERGRFRRLSVDAEGCFHSQVLSGLWLRVDWLWQKPKPPLLSILRGWKLI